MARIKTIGPDEATGALKERYEAAIQRAGRVWKSRAGHESTARADPDLN